MTRHSANGKMKSAETPTDVDKLLRAALARDFQLLALLHDREPTAELIESLRKVPARDWFGFRMRPQMAICACSLLDDALDALPAPVGQKTLDELAADYAAIYLIHTYRAPPTESPWLDKDQLERQEPMFELAKWYRKHGLEAGNRQLRSEDHIVMQLQFLAQLFSTPGLDATSSFAEAARFLDEHLLRWIDSFTSRVASRCETPYFCGVVTLTHAYLEAVRDHFAECAGLQRPQPQPQQAAVASLMDDEEIAQYLPGIAPSW